MTHHKLWVTIYESLFQEFILVIKHLPHSVGFMYKEEAFSKAAKNDIYQMIENIKIAFQEMFKN